MIGSSEIKYEPQFLAKLIPLQGYSLGVYPNQTWPPRPLKGGGVYKITTMAAWVKSDCLALQNLNPGSDPHTFTLSDPSMLAYVYAPRPLKKRIVEAVEFIQLKLSETMEAMRKNLKLKKSQFTSKPFKHLQTKKC